MAGLPETAELRLRRSSVHRHHDMKRLADGEDLNDALLDFFVKLGQAVIPCGGLEGGFPSVAYLGSLFYDILRKGKASDGRAGHANVANWARRKLGEGGLFFDGIGALAVPVNETLRDSNGQAAPKEKHWWMALLLNPRGGGRSADDEQISILCLDSVMRAEVRCDPPLRSYRRNARGYPLEVHGLYRQGFSAFVRFRALGDGLAGPIPDPRGSRLRLAESQTEFTRPNANLPIEQRGAYGASGRVEGQLEFTLEATSKLRGDYVLDFGSPGEYSPPTQINLKLSPNSFQREVARFLSGYVAKEWESSRSREPAGSEGTVAPEIKNASVSYDAARLESRFCLPDVPQQETANDCGFFILAQILLLLQLTPEGLRNLAGMPADILSQLPWPTQRDVTRRKVRLREALKELFEAADDILDNDVDSLLKKDSDLRRKIQGAMWDGPHFGEAVRRLAMASAPKAEYTLSEIGQMSTKSLRKLCADRGLLPAGPVERSDLLKVLVPAVVVTQRPSSPSATDSEATGDGQKRAAPGGADDPEAKRQRTEPASASSSSSAPAPPAPGVPPDQQHLGSMRFTVADLEKLPLKTLRGLCVQRKVLPANALEKADFVRALVPLATDVPASESGGGASPSGASSLGGASPFGASSLGGASPFGGGVGGFGGASPSAAAGAPSSEAPASNLPPETLEERKARWAKAVGAHLAGMRFEEEDLEVMPLKILRALCMQYKVLPACAVERADFVRALRHLVGDAAAAAAASAPANGAGTPTNGAPQKAAEAKEPKPRKDFSRFLGSAKPNFTRADIEEMPDNTLRTLCISHGVLPRGGSDAGRDALLEALGKLAIPEFNP